MKKRICYFFIISMLCSHTYAAENISRLELGGYVEGECSIKTMPTTMDLGDISSNSQEAKTFSFTLYCNTPMAYSVSSRDGALKNIDFSNVIDKSYTNEIPYALSIKMQGKNGSTSLDIPADIIQSKKIVKGSSNNITLYEINATLTITPQSISNEVQPIAGNYEDVLTLNIAPEGSL